jgi:tetratricopeptide (TPR) repeat protein
MNPDITLAEYPNRKAGSETNYMLIEQAIDALVVAGQPAQAVMSIGAAIDGFVAAADRRGEARARSKAAIVFRHLHDFERSRKEAEAALRFFESNPEPHFEATAALELGQVYEAYGDLDNAQRVYAHALASLASGARQHSTATRKLCAFLQDCAANIHAQRKEFAKAIELRKKAIPVLESLDLSHDVVTAWTNYAQDLTQIDAFEQGLDALQHAETWLGKLKPQTPLARSLRARLEMATTLVASGVLKASLQSDGQFPLLERGRLAARRAFDLFDGLKDPVNAVSAILIQADTEIECGSLEEAAEFLRAADRRLPPADESRKDLASRLRRRLDHLRAKHAARQPGFEQILPRRMFTDPRVSVSMADSPWVPSQSRKPPSSPVSDPADRLPSSWGRINPRRAIDEIEKRKSQGLIDMIERSRKK